MIGLDLGKNAFQVHGIDARGNVVVRKQLRRRQIEKFFCHAAASDCWHGGADPATEIPDNARLGLQLVAEQWEVQNVALCS